MHGSAPGRRGRLGGTLILVALGAFGVARFVNGGAIEPSSSTAAAVAVDIATVTADDVARLEAAVRTEPADLRAVQALGVAYVRAASTEPANYALARETFDRADQIRPGDISTELGRGLLAMTLHHFDDALVQADEILADNPASDAALLLRFDALMELGRFDDAEIVIERLVETEPGLATYTRVSYLRQFRGDMPGAISAMRQAVAAGDAQSQAQAETRALLADLLFIAGDYDKAQIEFEALLRDVPAMTSVRFGLAEVAAAQGDNDAALALIESLVATDPTLDAYILAGDLRAIAGDREGAATAYAEAERIFDSLAAAGEDVDMERAVFEADYGDPAEALRLARRAYDARPESVVTADALAWALHVNGDIAGAETFARRALRFGSIDHLLGLHSRVILDEAVSAPG